MRCVGEQSKPEGLGMKKSGICQLISCSFAFACATAYDSLVKGYIVFKSCSCYDSLYSSKPPTREN